MNLLKFLTKKTKKPELEFAFKEGKHSYSRIPSQLAMPIERFGKLQENIQWQSAGLSAVELRALIEIGETEMENLVAGKKGSLAKVGAIIQEMKMRSEMVIHTELLYHFLAIQLIRDDEEPAYYDDSIQLEKVEAFKEMVKKKDIWFIYQLPELKMVREQLNLSQQELNQLWEASIKEQERLKKMVEYLKSGVKSEKEKKTSIIS